MNLYLLSAEGGAWHLLEAVTQHQDQRQALALLVGTSGWLGSLHSSRSSRLSADNSTDPLLLKGRGCYTTISPCTRPTHGDHVVSVSTQQNWGAKLPCCARRLPKSPHSCCSQDLLVHIPHLQRCRPACPTSSEKGHSASSCVSLARAPSCREPLGS
jgi:hypothetical protein